MSDQRKTCPDCQQPLVPIKILDATTMLIGVNPAGYVEQRYASPDSTEGFLRKMPIEGIVKGWICPQCNRILLYGEPIASNDR